VKIKTAYHGND